MDKCDKSVKSEKEVGALCDQLAATVGWQAERYEQTRATRITEGLPDRRYVHRARGLRLWVELKRPGGKLTAAQHRWLAVELAAGGLGTVVEDVALLARLFSLLSRPMGKGEAVRVCQEVLELTAKRGYRSEPKRGVAA